MTQYIIFHSFLLGVYVNSAVNDSPDMDENTLKLKLTVCTLTSIVIVSFQIKCAVVEPQQHMSQYIWSSLYMCSLGIFIFLPCV